ncbi:hypothetical protein IC582_000383 [Cucumis melo]|uniref:Pentatricopeptide repeat-containing protein At1g03540 n=2 Tax=Cucumis melo TaxID=3656 RepID=A0A1S3C0U7_CUCME|nr:pentatricopeptide repeat-containing protein At1g03540 [Cucumis melo]KAA0031595.1 pentatricopeptide repeat-containing protein [Cucumis melo var. makuwa]TYK07047.1 pentatricopeptide repeat-containing protein [Cucumis melo var. makuwa]
MMLFFKRHCTSSFTSQNFKYSTHLSNKLFQILQFCKSGLLNDALHILNSVDLYDSRINKPLLYASLLQTCTKVDSFSSGCQFHAHVVKSGLETDRFVGNSLLSLYFKLGSNCLLTRRVFDGLFVKDVVSWASMITGYVREGKSGMAIELFWDMLDSGIEPNDFTLSTVIKACSEIGNLVLGKCFHGVVVRRGFDSNPVILSSLIDMYGRNYLSSEARQLFDELLEPDPVCWTTVISAFTRNDFYEEALGFFYLMHRAYRLSPDNYTFGSVLTACGNLGRLKQGEEIHAKVIAYGFGGNVVVESSLVDMYGKCGAVEKSQRVFDRMSNRNSVSWSALLAVYCQNGDFEKVVSLFREMKKVDLYSFGTVLRACAGLAAVAPGKEVHCQYIRKGGWRDVIVESALVDLYAKCGSIDFAYRIFERMPTRNLITWNAMIHGFAQNGRSEIAIQIFEAMIKEGIKPDCISFIGLLFACSHTGLVDQARHYFDLMTGEYGIKPGIEHYNCMVDLLGRAGLLEEAENLIENADCRNDSALWLVLLGASTATWTNSAIAERIAKKLMELEPQCYLSYVHLANFYRAVGRWDDAVKVRELMKNRQLKKMPGQSWMQRGKASMTSL